MHVISNADSWCSLFFPYWLEILELPSLWTNSDNFVWGRFCNIKWKQWILLMMPSIIFLYCSFLAWQKLFELTCYSYNALSSSKKKKLTVHGKPSFHCCCYCIVLLSHSSFIPRSSMVQVVCDNICEMYTYTISSDIHFFHNKQVFESFTHK